MLLIITGEKEFETNAFHEKIATCMSLCRLAKANVQYFAKYFPPFGGIYQYKNTYNINLLDVGLNISDFFATD